MNLKSFIRNPGTSFYKGNGKRSFYKALASSVSSPFSFSRKRFLKDLPTVEPTWKIERNDGFKIIPASETLKMPSVQGVLSRCDSILNSGVSSTVKGKGYLRQLLKGQSDEIHPDFMKLAFEPALLSAVADYLGELPVLTSVKFLHSVALEEALDGSQFYHCDHDDIRQVKLFLHVRDVEPDSGPLHVMPAFLSEKIRKRMNYAYGNYEGHIPDEKIRDEEVRSLEKCITGPRGTLSLVDASQCFHFGSRVAGKDRFIFYLQYLSRSNFLFNPLSPDLPKGIAKKLSRFPYADVKWNGMTPLQASVLHG